MLRRERWKHWAAGLERETYALYYACRDPRTPWYAKALAAVVVAYAFSPIDLIPDPIPVLGHLDDLLLVPLGVAAVRRLIPVEVLRDARHQADQALAAPRRGRWIAAGFIVLTWLLVTALVARVLWSWVMGAIDPQS